MSRKIIPLVVAFALVCLVMIVAGVFAYTGTITAEKFGSTASWSQPYAAAESMKAIDLTGDGQDDLFIQDPSNVTVFDGSGNTQFSFDYSTPKTTLGDLNGDGVDDIVVYYVGTGMSVDVIRAGQATTIAQALSIGFPARVAVIRFPSGPEIVLADSGGGLLALGPDGRPLWNATLGSEESRGLDDAVIEGQRYLAAANHGGSLAVFDEKGQIVWQNDPGQIRRMRAFDLNGDGTSEIITGGEDGQLIIWNAADGSQEFSKSLGQAISEVREVELNGEPSTREFVVGGKDGGVWAYSFDGTTASQLWSGSMPDKVTEIAGLDIDGDGRQEAVLGDDSGAVAIFTGNGTRHNLPSHSTGIARIDIGKLGGTRQVVIADASTVEVGRVNFSSLPGFQYTPLVVGAILSAVILLIAAILASIPPKPEMKVAFQDKSRESLEAERRMLKENIADVERLRQSGEVTGEAYLARLKSLRADLADNEAAFKSQGFPITVETFKCPNCGGTLQLGMDKCEYCGQVILT
jgi:putative pyrroloquinoline-quinone binding quinoprotein/VCBS repeat protein